ncbi:threonine transporter [Aeromonas hydrophila]|uniref:ABC-three component system middle component 2 n=1 Tax=Aeromonas hydrophila TaxID=644 RepID=UPI00191EEC20|nr:ABC-three component system middle component 2 [Aeromonas hydrophila]MBL0572098.1 threonine transporter [Aeromonas hydrophila]
MMNNINHTVVFNSPLEAGIRSLAILTASFPNSLDLHKLVELDYLVVHSGDVGGPSSLHAPLPLRVGELLIRQNLVKAGLHLMMSKGLIDVVIRNDGFGYMATESSSPFMKMLTSDYSLGLINRANWVVSNFQGLLTEEIRAITHSFFNKWSSQFDSTDKYNGIVK